MRRAVPSMAGSEELVGSVPPKPYTSRLTVPFLVLVLVAIAGTYSAHAYCDMQPAHLHGVNGMHGSFAPKGSHWEMTKCGYCLRPVNTRGNQKVDFASLFVAAWNLFGRTSLEICPATYTTYKWHTPYGLWACWSAINLFGRVIRTDYRSH
ncbi:hypothetical protein V2G26_007169 [Clonostachys chloroleuca]